MRTLQLFSLIALASALTPALAQAPADIQHDALLKDHKVVYFGEGTSVPDSAAQLNLINRFYMDQFRHSQDPRAPYFLLMSRNGKMAMGIGGTLKAIADYDFDGSISGTDFAPYNIPIPIDPANRTRFQTSIKKTNLFFSIFGTDNRFGNYQVYIEAKFAGGDGHFFKLSKAYATVNDFTLGYTKSTFVDPSSQPSTVDTEGPNSEVDDTRLLFRYMHGFGKHFTMAVSAETPHDLIPSYTYCKAGSDYMPNFAAFVQWGWNKQHVRLSGIVKPMRYRNLANAKNSYVTGWGLNLTAKMRPVDPLTIYAAVNTGYGISSMVNDLACGELDLLPYSDRPCTMYAPQSYGWYAGLEYRYRPNLYSTVVVSQERLLRKHDTLTEPSDYKYGLYGAANLFWEITPRCQVGAEFDMGKRCNIDGSNRLGYRVCALAQVSF